MDYRDVLIDEPSAMESVFAIFVNSLELDEAGAPTNVKYAERRAAVFLYQYLTGRPPPGESEISPEEGSLY